MLVGRTEEYHEGPEEGEGEELGGVVHKRIIRIFLRVHLRTECHTGNYIHCETAETPAQTETTYTFKTKACNYMLKILES